MFKKKYLAILFLYGILLSNYKDFTNAALPGGLELTDNVTVYQNAGSGSTYLNYALDPTGPTGAFGNVINIDKLPPDAKKQFLK